MRSGRLSALFAAVLMICSGIAASAQSSSDLELKRRQLERVASEAQMQSTETRGAQAAGGVQPLGVAEAADKKKALLGTWDLTLTFSDGSMNHSTLTVMPGRSDFEGTVIHSADASFYGWAKSLPEQGAWQYQGNGHFIASHFGWAYTPAFEMFGKVGFRQAITMSDDQETFTATAAFEIIDATGQVVFADNIRTAGVRQHAVAP